MKHCEVILFQEYFECQRLIISSLTHLFLKDPVEKSVVTQQVPKIIFALQVFMCFNPSGAVSLLTDETSLAVKGCRAAQGPCWTQLSSRELPGSLGTVGWGGLSLHSCTWA